MHGHLNIKFDNFDVLKILKYWDFNHYNTRTGIKPMWNCITNSWWPWGWLNF